MTSRRSRESQSFLLAGGSWPAAAAVVALAVAAGAVLPRLEVDHRWSVGFSYDAATAQAMLAAIAGGMITLTGFVLAAVTLMVQTIQNQSPRLLRVFPHARSTPVLFGVFTGTFVYALAVLSDVHPGRVPTLSAAIAIVLLLVSTGLFLRLLLVFRSTLTTGGLTRNVGAATMAAVDRHFTLPFEPTAMPDPADVGDARAVAIRWTLRHQGEPGHLQDLDEQRLIAAAVATDGLISIVPAIGDFVADGAPLATGTSIKDPPDDLARTLTVRPARTLDRDIGYGLRLLADISIRALSPAVNDPTSAVQALNQTDNLLRHIAARSLGDGRLADADGNTRVVYPAPTWEALLALALDETMQYGASSLQVARRLRALLSDLLEVTPDQRRAPVQSRLDALDRAVAGAFPDVGRREALQPDRQGLGSPDRTSSIRS